jgi:hypothetical protein
MAVSGFTKVLHQLRGDNPRTPRVRQCLHEPDKWLFEEELYRIAVHRFDPVHGLQQKTVGIARFRQEAGISELDIFSHQLAAVEGGLVVPFDAFAQMEDVGRVVWRFPAFGQIGLYGEGAWLHVGTDFMPHQTTADEAQYGIRIVIDREMGIKVREIPSTQTQGPAPLGRSHFRTPERGRRRERPGRQRHASRQAGLE